MVDPSLLQHIRKYRGQFSDEQIYGALIRDGHQPADLQEAFGLADAEESPGAVAPVRTGRWKLWLAVLFAGGTAVAAYLLAARPGARPKMGAAAVAAALSGESDGYVPAPLQTPDIVDAYLPPQTEGNAGEDYLEAGELFNRLGRPAVSEAALSGELAPVLAAIERGIRKKRYAVLGVLRTPASARGYKETLQAMIPASMFCSALGMRAERFEKRRDYARSYEESQTMLALGYHHMQSWLLFLQAPQGNECMMMALLRMRLALAGQGRDTPAERERLSRLAKQVMAYTADQKEVEAVLQAAQRPEQLASLDKYVVQALYHRPFLNVVLTSVAYGWSQPEAARNEPDSARLRFLTRAGDHADPRVAELAKGYLAQFQELRKFLVQVPPDERWPATKGLWMKLQSLKE